MVATEGDINEFSDQHTSGKVAIQDDNNDVVTMVTSPPDVVPSGSLESKKNYKKSVLSMTKPSYTLLRGFKNARHEHRVMLRCLTRKLVRQRNWREASGTLSVLLKATRKERSAQNNRMKYTAAMEILRHTESPDAYSRKAKQLYEIWGRKIGTRGKPVNDKYVQAELVLFLAKRNFEEANEAAKCLIAENENANDPFLCLFLGSFFFNWWYSELPKEMQIRSLDELPMPLDSDTPGAECHEPFENSYGYDAVSVNEMQTQICCQSEASVMNDRGINNHVNHGPSLNVSEAESQADVHMPQEDQLEDPKQFQSQGFYLNSVEMSEQDDGPFPDYSDGMHGASVLCARGLDLLLPIRLPHSIKDMTDFVSHWVLHNDKYKKAVEYLQLAVNSPLYSHGALVPLIQLLLIGDRVNEALVLVERCCQEMNSCCLLRLKARLLQCFAPKDYATLSTCFENILNKDPTDRWSLDSLLNLYWTGEYPLGRILEMIALHLEVKEGDSIIWKELASVFLKLFQCEEDRTSMCFNGTNVAYERSHSIQSRRIPAIFTNGTSGRAWKLRCKEWLNRHFSNKLLTSELAAGDMQLVTYKAACASYLYGREFEYVAKTCACLEEKQDKSKFMDLQMHIQNSVGICPNIKRKFK